MKFGRLLLTAFAVAALLMCASTASAAVTGGHLDVSNCAGGGVLVSESAIYWLPAGSLANTGCIDTGLGTNVTYTNSGGGTLGPGVVGNIKDLTPGGGAVDQFMTFTGTPLDFVLTSIGPGDTSNTVCPSTYNASNLALDSCSILITHGPATGTVSPFILTINPNNSTTVTLDTGGVVNDNGSGTTGNTTWMGAFTTQISNLTPAQIETIEEAGGTVSSTHSGDFSLSTVPEPSTISMILIGGGLIAFARKRKK
jgi:hypothetical protein